MCVSVFLWVPNRGIERMSLEPVVHVNVEAGSCLYTLDQAAQVVVSAFECFLQTSGYVAVVPKGLGRLSWLQALEPLLQSFIFTDLCGVLSEIVFEKRLLKKEEKTPPMRE